jgi:acyl-CoA thioesterase FadM
VPLADHLQEAAAEHARHLGVSIDRLAGLGLGWVMSRLIIRIEWWPLLGETMHIETWPSKRVGQLFHREFRLRDESDLLVGAASSSWALFDVHARQVVTVPRWLEQAVPWEPEEAVGFEGATVPRLTMAHYQRRVTPRLSDLDINGHVNNAQLLGWTVEPLPQRSRASRSSGRSMSSFVTNAGAMTASQRASKRRTAVCSTTVSSSSITAANSCERARSGVRDTQAADSVIVALAAPTQLSRFSCVPAAACSLQLVNRISWITRP